MHCMQWKVVLQRHARKKGRLKGTRYTKSLWNFPIEERMHTMTMMTGDSTSRKAQYFAQNQLQHT